MIRAVMKGFRSKFQFRRFRCLGIMYWCIFIYISGPEKKSLFPFSYIARTFTYCYKVLNLRKAFWNWRGLNNPFNGEKKRIIYLYNISILYCNTFTKTNSMFFPLKSHTYVVIGESPGWPEFDSFISLLMRGMICNGRVCA